MLMPERQRLGGEHGLDQPADEQLLDDLLERGQQPGVVGGEPALQPVEPLPVAEDLEILGRDVRRYAPATISRISVRSSGVGQPQTRAEALAHGGVAAGPAEDEQ